MTTNVIVRTTYTLVVGAAQNWCTISNPTGVNIEFATTEDDITGPDEDIVGHVLPTYNGVPRHHIAAGAIYARLADRSHSGNTTILVVDSGT